MSSQLRTIPLSIGYDSCNIDRSLDASSPTIMSWQTRARAQPPSPSRTCSHGHPKHAHHPHLDLDAVHLLLGAQDGAANHRGENRLGKVGAGKAALDKLHTYTHTHTRSCQTGARGHESVGSRHRTPVPLSHTTTCCRSKLAIRAGPSDQRDPAREERVGQRQCYGARHARRSCACRDRGWHQARATRPADGGVGVRIAQLSASSF
jgi:hypothetical protein